jgi:anti-sigma factor RsiW
MNCDRVQKVLDAHLDKELDEVTDAQLAQHLSSCPSCAGVRAEREALRAAFRLLPRHESPVQLRRAITSALTTVDRFDASMPRRSVSWWQAFACAGAAATLSFVLGLWVATPPVSQDPRDDAIARHVASLASGQQHVQVNSTDRHVVKPWFAGKIDFAPPVRDLAEHGFALVGGRIDTLAGKSAAAILYRIRQHDVNLFVSRAAAPRAEPLATSTLRGFSVVTWSNDGLSFTAVSDIEPAELQRFSQLVSAPSP